MFEKFIEPDFGVQEALNAPNVRIEKAPSDGVAPDNYHSMSIFPEYFKVDGQWLLAKESRMDCVPVLAGKEIKVVEFRNLKKDDRVIVGRTESFEEGIFVYPDGFRAESSDKDAFSFRSSRSRETAFSADYDDLINLLRYEKKNGKIVWVLGPAFSFDTGAKKALCSLIEAGYVHALLAGNALATHDLEGAYLHTALGQDIYTQKSVPNGHYNHLDLLNKVRSYGSIKKFIEGEKIKDGIIFSCEKKGVPYVLAGSIRDDGPLPPVFGNVYEAQDAMRRELKDATTVICMATMLHTIATGNMTSSYRVLADGTVRQVYFYCVDISEFVIHKLADRGSLSAKGIVTNVQDFIIKIKKGLE